MESRSLNLSLNGLLSRRSGIRPLPAPRAGGLRFKTQGCIVQGHGLEIGFLALTTNGPMMATRAVGLGGEMGSMTRSNGVFHAQDNPDAVRVEVHQDHRKGRLRIPIVLEPAVHGPMPGPHVHRGAGRRKTKPQQAELMVFFRNSRSTRNSLGNIRDWMCSLKQLMLLL
jgi:hypothetical protein